MNSRRFYLKYQGFTVPFVLLLLSGFVFFGVIIPVAKQALSTYSDARIIADEVAVLKKRLSVLQQLDESTLERQLMAITAAIPIEKSLPTILRTLEGVSAETQVTVMNLTMNAPGSIATDSADLLSEEEQKFGMHLLPFTVSLNGSFEQLKAFLSLSTKVRRFIRAKEFSVNFQSGSNPNQITTDVSFDAFYSPLLAEHNDEQLTPLIPLEEKTLSNIVGYPNVGEITLVANSAEAQPLTPRANPFSE